MFKRIIIAIVALPVLIVFGDAVLGPRSAFGGNLDVKSEHLITGGPQRLAIDVDDAITLFDETCMAATVFKDPPYAMDAAFRAAGLAPNANGEYVPPKGPLHAFVLERPDGGFECFVTFVSHEDIEGVIKPAFDTFSQTRMNRPWTDAPDAFQFESIYSPVPEGVQSDQPTEPDPALIRAFADDRFHYYPILRPDSYRLRHLLQLIILPEAVVAQP